MHKTVTASFTYMFFDVFIVDEDTPRAMYKITAEDLDAYDVTMPESPEQLRQLELWAMQYQRQLGM